MKELHIPKIRRLNLSVPLAARAIALRKKHSYHGNTVQAEVANRIVHRQFFGIDAKRNRDNLSANIGHPFETKIIFVPHSL